MSRLNRPQLSRIASSPRRRGVPSQLRGLTLVEMLIAMAITLVMMAAVVTVFANISSSVINRRATIEMASQVRHVRSVLQRDLAGATCPAVPWQKPESNHGYIEIIEGPQSDFDPSLWIRDRNNDGDPDEFDLDSTDGPENLDLGVSTLPSSNLYQLPGSSIDVRSFSANASTDGGALGDADDVLALTVRNEEEPFIGRVPNGATLGSGNPVNFPQWTHRNADSTLAEVIWFTLENPLERSGDESFYFTEPGFRTVYRRALLIAPWLNYGFNINGQRTGPGVVRVLGSNVANNQLGTIRAFAALVAFQDRYDLSVRLEWDPHLGSDGRWKIVANTLADLTKRENRYEHFGHISRSTVRRFPFPMVTSGNYDSGTYDVTFYTDQEYGLGRQDNFAAIVPNDNTNAIDYFRHSETGRASDNDKLRFPVRPFAYISDEPNNGYGATLRAVLNEDGRVVHVTTGPAPLGGRRRGEDIMLTEALAFDLRIFDPEAPVLAEINDTSDTNFPGEPLEPGDAGWGIVLQDQGTAARVLSRGAYVDLGYLPLHQRFWEVNDGRTNIGNWPTINQALLANNSLFAGLASDRSQLRPTVTTAILNNGAATRTYDKYRVYDTWSFHYENNGINEDNDEIEAGLPQNNNGNAAGTPLIDEGTDHLDSPDNELTVRPRDNIAAPLGALTIADYLVRGPDDLGERETSPPYDLPLRGLQVIVRAHEADSRQIREVKVSHTFVPK